MIVTNATGYVAVYDNGSPIEHKTAVVCWQEHDLTVYGLVAQDGYPFLKPAHHLPGFKRYEAICAPGA